jgi:hypothetical protein
MASTFVDGGAAARGRAERHFDRCGLRPMTAPPCESHALATDVLTLLAMLDVARRDLKRAAFLAEHLWQMVSPETWRDTGGDDGQGHYEGDYHAEQTRIEIQELAARAALGVEGEQEKPT